MLKALLEKRAGLLARCKEIEDKAQSETRTMTDAERTEYRAALDESKALKLQIAELQEAEQERSDNAAALAAAPKVAAPTREEQQRAAGGAPKIGAITHDNAEDAPFKSLSEQLFAVRSATVSRGMTMDPRLRKFDLSDVEVRAASGMNTMVGSEGGFLIGTDQGGMLEKTAFETGILSARVTKIPLSANSNGIKMNYIDETSRATGSRFGGVRAYWINEATAPTSSKPAVGKFELGLNKLAALVYLTDEELQDASAAESIVTQAVNEELAFSLDDAIYRGTGAGLPLGVLNAPCLVTVSKETSQVAATVVYENVSKMRIRMTPRMFSRSAWFVNNEVLPQLEQMNVKIKNVAGTENVGGLPVFIPPGGASAQPYGSLFGRPVIPIEHCEALGTVGDIALMDLGYYMMSTKGGVQTASSIHVNFLTDEQAFRFILRTDGRIPLKSAITPYKGSATLSPFVVLATRA